MGLVTSTTRSESLESLIRDHQFVCHIPEHKSNGRSLASPSPSPQNPPNLSHLNISHRFTASLLDESFGIVYKGELELKLDRLTFYYKNASQILSLYWPLSCVRWYGGCSHLFIFESGRQSKFGVGCFLFKCKKSRQLISHIQKQTSYLVQLQSDYKVDITTLLSSPSVSGKSEGTGSDSAETRSTLCIRSRALTASSGDSDQNSEQTGTQLNQSNNELSSTQFSDDYITLPNPVPSSNRRSSPSSSSHEHESIARSRSTVYISYPQLMNSFLPSSSPTNTSELPQSNDTSDTIRSTHNNLDCDCHQNSSDNNNYLVIVPDTHVSSCQCNSRQGTLMNELISSSSPSQHPYLAQNQAQPILTEESFSQTEQQLQQQEEENLDLGQYVIALASHNYVNQAPRLISDMSQTLVAQSSQNVYVEEPVTMIHLQS